MIDWICRLRVETFEKEEEMRRSIEGKATTMKKRTVASGY